MFISFVHEDEAVAKAVQGVLQWELKFQDVFMISDRSKVFAGTDWFDRIRHELTSAEVVVLMMSKRSVKRPWVNFEAGAGWLAGKPLVSVCYGNLSKGALPRPYSDFQALDLPVDEEDLIQSVAHHLKVSYVPSALRKLFAPQEEREMFNALSGIMRPDVRLVLEGFTDED